MRRGISLVFCLLQLLAFAQEQVQCRVSVTSQPSGATVIVDGRDRGTTPITLFDLEPGRHHIKYRLAGYVERDRYINTNEGPFIEKCEVLREEKGLLLLKSDPEGCDIRIDGVSVGQTPRLITNLASKNEYTVRLVKAGYQDHTIVVRFDGRKPLVREEKLVLDSGVINVISEPAGAEVVVNGISRGTTPVLVKGIPKGRATVKFRMEGFQDEIREIAMKAGDQQTLQIAMTALPGTLHLESVPEGARFYLNNEARGVGPLTIASLKPGEYVVRAEKDGYGTITKTITLENGQSAREEFRMSNVMGRLEIRTCPSDVTVLIDGHVVGTSKAPTDDTEFSDVFPIESLLEGEHTLVLRKEGYEEMVLHPKVQNSKTAKAKLRLKRIFIPDVEIVTDSGNYRGILKSNNPDSVEVEVMLGITRSFARDKIRKINFLKKVQ